MLCDVVRHYIENDNDNYCSRDESLSSHSRMQYIGRLVDCDYLTCVEQLRMNRVTFNRLCDLLRTEGETVSRHFNKVLNVVIRCSKSLTSMPEPVLEGCTNGKWKRFKNCLGALDGTHIKLQVPLIDKSRYKNLKGDITTNVLGVCLRNLQFVFVLPKWEGSASDSRVLRDAIARENGLRVPVVYYYLVDAGYTNGPGFLAPYRGTRREMPYDPFEHLLDQVEPSVKMEPIENIASVESTDE
ncbi:hypothetical protein SLA2020_191390 [Shorea laevis]